MENKLTPELRKKICKALLAACGLMILFALVAAFVGFGPVRGKNNEQMRQIELLKAENEKLDLSILESKKDYLSGQEVYNEGIRLSAQGQGQMDTAASTGEQLRAKQEQNRKQIDGLMNQIVGLVSGQELSQ